MSISLCIPTRGRPGLFREATLEILGNSELSETRVVLGIDTDDAESIAAAGSEEIVRNKQIIVSTASREDSLGAKYNRVAAARPADIYVLWADDAVILTKGWDRTIEDAARLFPDGMGVIYFGEIPGILQTGIAVTHKFAQKMGFFCVPYFPFWWHDTWVDEIARMTDRIVNVNVAAKCLTELKGTSRGVREIAWWGNFFESTRPQRIQAANAIIEEGTDPPYRKLRLRQIMPDVVTFLSHRNSKCTNPVSAAELEKHYSFDAPADDRYLRVKQAAEGLLASIKQ